MKRILIVFALALSLVLAVSCASSQAEAEEIASEESIEENIEAEENDYSEEGEGVERRRKRCTRIAGFRVCV